MISRKKKKERAAHEKTRRHLNEIRRRTREDSDTEISNYDDEDSCEDSLGNERESTTDTDVQPVTDTDVQPVTCILPARMLCFVDLTDIAPSTCESDIKAGVYALVEKAVLVEDSWMSQLLIPYTKKSTLELANISSIVAPVCMIPDTGMRTNKGT